MKIILNGKEIELKTNNISLKEFVELKLKDKPKFFAIAVNNEVIPKHKWDEYKLKNGDKIEIVSIFQGG